MILINFFRKMGQYDIVLDFEIIDALMCVG